MTEEEKKKLAEEEEKKKSEGENPAKEEPKDEPKDESPMDKPADEEPKPEKAEEKPKGDEPKNENPKEDEPKDEPKADGNNELEELKAENLRLKTQVSAMGLGFKAECIEDAVVLAENLVKQGEKDIETALNAVLKKYPDWKDGKGEAKKSSGFKVGADSSNDDKSASEDKLKSAFGIKKKEGK